MEDFQSGVVRNATNSYELKIKSKFHLLHSFQFWLENLFSAALPKLSP